MAMRCNGNGPNLVALTGLAPNSKDFSEAGAFTVHQARTPRPAILLCWNKLGKCQPLRFWQWRRSGRRGRWFGSWSRSFFRRMVLVVEPRYVLSDIHLWCPVNDGGVLRGRVQNNRVAIFL